MTTTNPALAAYNPTPVDLARSGVDRTVRELVTAADPQAFTTEPIWPGAATTVSRPHPIPALQAAQLVERIAHGLVRENLGRARAEGHSWLQLAVALDLAAERPDWERAAAAFDLATGPSLSAFRDPSVRWTCTSCAQRITDRGPEAGQGDDEHGHTNDCARRTAQLAQWRHEWDDDEDPDDADDWDELDDEDDEDDDSDHNPLAPVGSR